MWVREDTIAAVIHNSDRSLQTGTRKLAGRTLGVDRDLNKLPSKTRTIRPSLRIQTRWPRYSIRTE